LDPVSYVQKGDMKRATYAIAVSSILNMVIAPVFIYTLKMGIKGAAIATIISSLVAAVAIFYWILIKKTLISHLN